MNQNLDRFRFRAWRYYPSLGEGTLISGWDLDYFFKEFDPRQTEKLKNEEVIIMQCTGIKDKNEEFIYEGDILQRVSRGRNETWEVKYELSSFMAIAISPDAMNCFIGDNDCYDIRIVGNIYENPELLNAD